jgi:hypothetical protein
LGQRISPEKKRGRRKNLTQSRKEVELIAAKDRKERKKGDKEGVVELNFLTHPLPSIYSREFVQRLPDRSASIVEPASPFLRSLRSLSAI